MKKIFLYAYDKVNLGDDLFIRNVSSRYPKTRFYLWSDKTNKRIFKDCKNLKVLNSKSLFLSLLSRLIPSLSVRYKSYFEKRSDAVVYIGGSIFIEYKTWKNMLNWWKYEAESYPFYILGANFGPYTSEDYRKGMAEIFASSRDVCLREKSSYELFEGVSTVRYAPDILFGTNFDTQTIKKQIFISPIDCSNRSELSCFDTEYKTRIASLCTAFINDGYSVVLSGFCRAEGDCEAVDQIYSSLDEDDKKSVRLLNYNGLNHSEVLNCIAESELVIASRFHASVLAISAGRPLYPIIYSVKTANMLKDIGYIGNISEIASPDSITARAAYSNLTIEDLIDAEALRHRSQEHFKMLDEILE